MPGDSILIQISANKSEVDAKVSKAVLTFSIVFRSWRSWPVSTYKVTIINIW